MCVHFFPTLSGIGNLYGCLLKKHVLFSVRHWVQYRFEYIYIYMGTTKNKVCSGFNLFIILDAIHNVLSFVVCALFVCTFSLFPLYSQFDQSPVEKLESTASESI